MKEKQIQLLVGHELAAPINTDQKSWMILNCSFGNKYIYDWSQYFIPYTYFSSLKKNLKTFSSQSI